MKKDIIKAADQLAEFRHRKVGQLRKYTGEPYIVHPRAVARMVREYNGTKEMIAAALLHDVMEDTLTEDDTEDVVRMQILGATNAMTLRMVIGLTDVAKKSDGNRAARLAINIEHLAKQPGYVQTIKLCDILDNVSSIVKHDPKFAEVWLDEKRTTLPFLKNGDQSLYWRVYDKLYGRH